MHMHAIGLIIWGFECHVSLLAYCGRMCAAAKKQPSTSMPYLWRLTSDEPFNERAVFLRAVSVCNVINDLLSTY